MKLIKFTIALLCAVFIFACTKPGPGGKASISLQVKASKLSAPATQVYLKYDSKTSPGASPDSYDQVKVTNNQGEVYFTNLQKGDYFIRSSGFDSILLKPVVAELAVEIKKKTEVVSKIMEMN